jgi:methyltransferase
MAMTAAYLALLLLVGLGRLLELRISRRNRRRLTEQGAGRVYEPHFRWMVLLHAGVLAGAAAEVLWLKRPLIPALAVPMFVLFVLANLLRWWVIRTLAGHWNVGVMKSSNLGVVTSGPYHWIRHPNYVAVATELFADDSHRVDHCGGWHGGKSGSIEAAVARGRRHPAGSSRVSRCHGCETAVLSENPVAAASRFPARSHSRIFMAFRER